MRIAAMLMLVLGLAACANHEAQLAETPEPMGNFRLGFSEVVAPNLEKLLVSRDATAEEWVALVDQAVEARLGRYDGPRFYHLGISVEAYSLPPPIIPGKSALAVRVTVWDDAAQAKMNQETELISVIRVLESRITSTRESQMAWLANEVARLIEVWLREQHDAEGWFATGPADTGAVATPDAQAALPAAEGPDPS